jgi:hypothetical protein
MALALSMPGRIMRSAFFRKVASPGQPGLTARKLAYAEKGRVSLRRSLFHWLKAMDVGSVSAIIGADGGAGIGIVDDDPAPAEVLARAPSAIQSTGVKRKAFKLRDNMLDIMGYASLFDTERQAANRVSL